MTKVCSKCNIEQDISQFSLNKKSLDGHKTICKNCCKKQDNKYRQEHLEQHKEYMKDYNSKNKQKAKEYYEQNKETIRKQQKIYYDKMHREN